MEYTTGNFMEEQEIHLRDILVVLSDRKWVIILGAVAVILGAVLYLLMATPIYEAEVVMLYEKTNPTAAVLDTLDFRIFQSELELEAQKAFLMSPMVLKETRKKLKEQGIELPLKENETEEDYFKGVLDLSSPRGTKVLKLKARAESPSVAAMIANTVAQTFVEKRAEWKRADLDNALTFLQRQLSAIDDRLKKAYEKLTKFKEKENLIETPSPTGGMVLGSLLQKLGLMQEELEGTKSEIIQTQASLDSVKSLIERKKKRLDPSLQGMTTPGGVTPQIDALRQQIADLRTELDSKLDKYTEKHWEVVDLKRRLESAQKRLREEIAKLSKVKGETLDPLSEWQSLISRWIQLEVKLKELERKKALFETKIEKFKADHPDLVAKDVELMQLEKERKMLEETYKTLQAKLEEMRLMKEMRTSDVDIVKNAIEPRFPVKPKTKLTLALAIVLGAMFGVGLAFLLEYMDNTIKTKEDVDRFLGVSTIGIIPRLDEKRLKSVQLKPLPTPSGGDSGGNPGTAVALRRRRSDYQKQIESLVKRKLTNLKPRNPVVESYRTIRANIRFASIDRDVRSLLITSVLPREGKSLFITNLAITFAKSGTRTALVDCDLHRPKLHHMFGFEKSPGLSELLTEQVEGNTIEEKIERVIRETDVENLYLITSGTLPPNPGDLMVSERLNEILGSLRSSFEMVLIDSPPMSLISDTSVLATRVDSTILVIRAGMARIPSILQAKETLENLGAKIFGVVLNDLDIKSRRYSGYYYYSKYSDYYSPEEEE